MLFILCNSAPKSTKPQRPPVPAGSSQKPPSTARVCQSSAGTFYFGPISNLQSSCFRKIQIKFKKGAGPDVALHKQSISLLWVLVENLPHSHNVPLSSGAAKWDKPMSPRAGGEQQRCWAGEHSLEPLELLWLFTPLTVKAWNPPRELTPREFTPR